MSKFSPLLFTVSESNEFRRFRPDIRAEVATDTLPERIVRPSGLTDHLFVAKVEGGSWCLADASGIRRAAPGLIDALYELMAAESLARREKE